MFTNIVAPYVGAWIETYLEVVRYTNRRSHPTWVRGLKLCGNASPIVRQVAPYVGAWIETLRANSRTKLRF